MKESVSILTNRLIVKMVYYKECILPVMLNTGFGWNFGNNNKIFKMLIHFFFFLQNIVATLTIILIFKCIYKVDDTSIIFQHTVYTKRDRESLQTP